MRATNFVAFPPARATPAATPAADDADAPPPSPPPLRQWRVTTANATIEFSIKPSYNTPFRGGRDDGAPTWRPGASRLNVSAAVAGAGSPPTLTAMLHAAPCAPLTAFGAATPARTVYSADGSYRHAYVAGFNGVPLSDGGNETSTAARASMRLTGACGKGSASVTLPYLVDYDAVGSVVLYAPPFVAGAPPTPVACIGLAPPPPTFPDEWGATIEANLVDAGYTLPLRQIYSKKLGKVRTEVHSLGANRVIIQDFGHQTVTLIDPPKGTNPRGACRTMADAVPAPGDAATTTTTTIPGLPFGGGVGVGGTGAGLLSTADALAFDAKAVQFVPGVQTEIRGIPCELWARTISAPPPLNATLDVTYYVPVSQWLTGGEGYHRMLKAIVVNGTAFENGVPRAVLQEYHFINFRPRPNLPASVFDACTIAPKGEGCGCGKSASGGGATDADAVPYSAATTPTLISTDAPDASSTPRGFVPEQAGPYVLLTLVGLVGGVTAAIALPAAARAIGARRSRKFEQFDAGRAAAPVGPAPA